MGISRFARLNAPVVVAVHGLAAGGAVALVAGADFVLASPNAKFYAAFAGIGIISDSGGSYFLPRRMGSRRAAQFYMLNETLERRRSRRRRVSSTASSTPTRSRRKPGRSPAGWRKARRRAFGEAKNLLLSSPTESLEGQLEKEARAMARVTRTDDAWNAMRAVLAKRKPNFQAR